MNLLIINTTTRSIRLLLQRGAATYRRQWEADHTLGRALLENIDQLLQESGMALPELTRIAVHAGSGHPSAIRTGVTVASFLAWSSEVDLVVTFGHTEEELVDTALSAVPQTVISL